MQTLANAIYQTVYGFYTSLTSLLKCIALNRLYGAWALSHTDVCNGASCIDMSLIVSSGKYQLIKKDGLP